MIHLNQPILLEPDKVPPRKPPAHPRTTSPVQVTTFSLYIDPHQRHHINAMNTPSRRYTFPLSPLSPYCNHIISPKSPLAHPYTAALFIFFTVCLILLPLLHLASTLRRNRESCNAPPGYHIALMSGLAADTKSHVEAGTLGSTGG